MKFRRAVRDEEKICDDIAVSLTKNAAALAAALKILHRKIEIPEPDPRKFLRPRVSLEEYSHKLHLEDRIKRLEEGATGRMERWGVPFTLALLTAAVLNYFIV